ncbi:MAG: T9SS type A sorting domain-containing protein, partial [Bacteroidota bacterium]
FAQAENIVEEGIDLDMNQNLPSGPRSNALPPQVTVFPNPVTSSKLTVNLPGNTGRAGLNLYAVSGNTVTSQVATGEVTEMELPSLSPGFYLLEVVIDGQRTVKKLMVE